MVTMATIPLTSPAFSLQTTKKSLPRLVCPASAQLTIGPPATKMKHLSQHLRFSIICSKREILKTFCTTRSIDLNSNPLSPADTITQFYSLINDKNTKRLSEFISDDCFFEELSFFRPFRGKKEVMHFLNKLTEGLGKNVKFVIESVFEGSKDQVGVVWHMEWKKHHIPFTRGCSYYGCIERGEKLVIEKARIVVESPVKPGEVALILLKTISSLFDRFPMITEKFLQRPEALFQWLLKVHKRFIKPFLCPIFAYYTYLWKLLTFFFGYILNTLLKILKIFNRNH